MSAIYDEPDPAPVVIYSAPSVPPPSRYDVSRYRPELPVEPYVAHVQNAHRVAWLGLGVLVAICLAVTLILLCSEVIWPALRG